MTSNSNPAFTALQVQVLDELGIDLWLSRASEKSQQPLPPRNRTSLEPEPVSKHLPVTTGSVPQVLQAPGATPDYVAYDLLCMRNSQLLVVAQIHSASDEALLGSLMQVSVPGNPGQNFAFNWPQPNSSPGLDAARKAFLAFTSVQASKIETPVLVIFGNSISLLLSDSLSTSKDGVAPTISSFDWNGFRCVLVPDVESMRMHWQLKRDLCTHLTHLLPKLFSLREDAGQSKNA